MGSAGVAAESLKFKEPQCHTDALPALSLQMQQTATVLRQYVDCLTVSQAARFG